MAGLTDDTLEFVELLNQNLATRERVIGSEVQKKHDQGLLLTMEYLRRQQERRDIETLFSSELLALTHSLENDVISPEEETSLNAGINQLTRAYDCYKALTGDFDAYKKMQDTYEKEDGLPIDVARNFFKSHYTRLQNILRSNSKAPKLEKDMVRLRRDSLKIMREIYIEIQRKALAF